MSRTPKTLWIQAIRKCGGRCWFCGEEATTVDHATPRDDGGRNTPENLLPACLRCNNTKGNMTVEMFRKYVKACIARKLIEMGFAHVDLHHRIRIVFYGEGNLSPFRW